MRETWAIQDRRGEGATLLFTVTLHSLPLSTDLSGHSSEERLKRWWEARLRTSGKEVEGEATPPSSPLLPPTLTLLSTFSLKQTVQTCWVRFAKHIETVFWWTQKFYIFWKLIKRRQHWLDSLYNCLHNFNGQLKYGINKIKRENIFKKNSYF